MPHFSRAAIAASWLPRSHEFSFWDGCDPARPFAKRQLGRGRWVARLGRLELLPFKVESLAQSERLISPGVPSVSEPNGKRTQGEAERGRVWGGDVPLAIEPPVEPLSALP
jgi:hypothetical protein